MLKSNKSQKIIFFSRKDEHKTLDNWHENRMPIFGRMLEFFVIIQPFLCQLLISLQNIQKMKEINSSRALNIDDIISKLTQKSFRDNSFPLKEFEVDGLCVMARRIFAEQPMLLQLQAPVQICGDTHGQYQDLLTIFHRFGSPQQHNYLFLGDYVDRGKQSLECICLLFAYKIKFPDNFFLLRGNHQASQVNKLYGFYDECKRRMSIRIWKMISDSFNFLPVAAVVAGRIFCVHGGLSPLTKHLSTVNLIRRPIEPHANKMLSDMLWSDPKANSQGWSDNIERGISHYYGSNVVNLFLNRNEFDLICRSHQVVEQGYQFAFNRRLITIFSAPNYCGQFTNMAAILLISAQLLCKIQQFQGQPIRVKRLHRSVTPIHKNMNSETNVEDKGREGTRIVKVKLQKCQKVQLPMEDDNYPKTEDSQTQCIDY